MLSGDLIVSASGIRGVVGRGLDADTAERYGAAYAAYLSERYGARTPATVLLGRDSRTTGRQIAEAVATGLASSGWDVDDLGIVPTPTALLAVQDDDVACGGVVVTASHNPAEWNGLKLASAAGEFIAPAAGQEVQARFEALVDEKPGGRLHRSGTAGPRRGRIREVTGAIERHLARILALPLLSPFPVRSGLRVALDCVRGTGGLILPTLLERMGCQVTGIHLEPDGRFPRDPEPVASALGELGELVRRTEADVGMAVDPDGDRLALVDECGLAIGEDWTLALAVELVLSKRPGPVVTNLSSSQCIEDAACRAGQRLYRAPVGEANVAQRMAQVGAVVGGEGNGGVMLPELHATRDAPLAAALVVRLLSDRNDRLGRLLGDLPSYRVIKRKIERPAGSLATLYERLESEAPSGAEVDRQDGLRLAWPARREWIHIRPSGTEPIMRVIAEAPADSAARSLADWAVELLSG